LAPSSIRVLVVDDFEPFRRFVCSTLQNSFELPTIREAADGVEAVELAQALQPHLILLDIGIPKLNGIDAARRIRDLSPDSKILFVSQESSVDVVEGAFSVGASGYVVKMEAGRELMDAVRAVLRGERFVGRRFAGQSFAGVSDAPAIGDARGNVVFAPPQRRNVDTASRHEVGFYSDDRWFLDHVAQFISAHLKVGDAVIVVATESHRVGLLSRLQVPGLDIGVAIEQGRYNALDVVESLSQHMINDRPDPARFLKLFGNLVARAAEAAKAQQARVAVFGEGVQLLWAQGNAEAVIQIEKLSNELAKTYDVDILCGYSLGCVQGGMDSHIFQRIRAEHSVVHSG
jgi:DNA-binding response OmpR family regulator